MEVGIFDKAGFTMKQDAGENFVMTDAEILKVDSPRESLWGPYAVVYKADPVDERWAIAALGWCKKNRPSLGIKWFWDKGRIPCSHGYATWFVIPKALIDCILSALQIPQPLRGHVDGFLSRKNRRADTPENPPAPLVRKVGRGQVPDMSRTKINAVRPIVHDHSTVSSALRSADLGSVSAAIR